MEIRNPQIPELGSATAVIADSKTLIRSGDAAKRFVEMNLWDQILARVETKVNRHSFYTWFKPTSFVAEDAGADHRPGAERRSSRTG